MELVNFTCEWPNSQLDPPLVASLRRLVVNHSVASYVTWHGHKLVASHSSKFLSHANFCRVRQVTRVGGAQVVGRSLIGRKASQVIGGRSHMYHGGRAMVVILGPEFMPIDLRMASKSVVVRSQVTLITCPIIHFLFTHMSVAPQHQCKH